MKSKGLAAHAAGAHLLPFKYDAGELKPNEVAVRISHCGVCRSDVHLIDNDWGMSKYPFIPGHEIVGQGNGGRHGGARPEDRATGGHRLAGG